MDRLGGLVHRMPRSAVITFVGTLGIAALPPLNGFVSEWLIFQGLFQGFRTGSHLVGILIVRGRRQPGPDRRAGDLRVRPRLRHPVPGHAAHRQAAAASERGQPVAGPALLAVACVALAVGAPVVLLALARPPATVTGVTLRPVLLPGNLTVIPAHADFSAFSPTYLAVFLVAVTRRAAADLPGRPAARRQPHGAGVGRRDRRVQAPHAVLGDDVLRPDPGHLRRALPALGRPCTARPTTRPGAPARCTTNAQVTPIFERYLYRPVVRAFEWLADVVRPIQSGDVNLYLFYVSRRPARLPDRGALTAEDARLRQRAPRCGRRRRMLPGARRSSRGRAVRGGAARIASARLPRAQPAAPASCRRSAG